MQCKFRKKGWPKIVFAAMLMIGIVLIMNGRIFGAEHGPGYSNWKEQRIHLSRSNLAFRIPSGMSKSVPPSPTVSEVDLERDLKDSNRVLGIFRHTWDYDGGWWKGVLGYLSVGVTVAVKPKNYDKDLTSLDNLQELIRLELERTYTERSPESRSKGKTVSKVILPETFSRVRIYDREWLKYSLTGTFDRIFYTTFLNNIYYITVTFDYVDNSRGYQTNWRREAEDISDKIAGSLELQEGSH
jgi:hypothetical protein